MIIDLLLFVKADDRYLRAPLLFYNVLGGREASKRPPTRLITARAKPGAISGKSFLFRCL